MIKEVTASKWRLEQSPSLIAKQIDKLKFGRPQYGYGVGPIPINTNTFALFPRSETAITEEDRFSPTQFQHHTLMPSLPKPTPHPAQTIITLKTRESSAPGSTNIWYHSDARLRASKTPQRSLQSPFRATNRLSEVTISERLNGAKSTMARQQSKDSNRFIENFTSSFYPKSFQPRQAGNLVSITPSKLKKTGAGYKVNLKYSDPYADSVSQMSQTLSTRT